MRDNDTRVCDCMFALTWEKGEAIKLTLPLQTFKTKHKEIEIEYFINRARGSELGETKTQCALETQLIHVCEHEKA